MRSRLPSLRQVANEVQAFMAVLYQADMTSLAVNIGMSSERAVA